MIGAFEVAAAVASIALRIAVAAVVEPIVAPVEASHRAPCCLAVAVTTDCY